MALNGLEMGMRVRVIKDETFSGFKDSVGTVVGFDNSDYYNIQVALDDRTLWGYKFWFNHSELAVIEGVNDANFSGE